LFFFYFQRTLLAYLAVADVLISVENTLVKVSWLDIAG